MSWFRLRVWVRVRVMFGLGFRVMVTVTVYSVLCTSKTRRKSLMLVAMYEM